jgi:hypothetical protein
MVPYGVKDSELDHGGSKERREQILAESATESRVPIAHVLAFT